MLALAALLRLEAVILEVCIRFMGVPAEAVVTAGLVLWRLATLITPFLLGLLALIHWQRTDGRGITWRSPSIPERQS